MLVVALSLLSSPYFVSRTQHCGAQLVHSRGAGPRVKIYKDMIAYHRHISFLFLLLFSTCAPKTRDEGVEDAIVLESIKLSELSGQEIDMAKFQNKTVFINFWATWCKPCIQEMPTIERAQAQLIDKDIVFLMASNESVERIVEFRNISKFQFHFVQVKNLEALNIQALPTTFIFNQQGELVFAEAGFRMWDTPENIRLITKDSEL